MNILIKLLKSKMLFMIVTIFFLLSSSYSNDVELWNFTEKKDKEYPEWSFSFYIAAAFGGPADNIGFQMRRPGLQDHYNFSTYQMLYSVSKFRPQSWMIELDYRMMKRLGIGLLYGYSDLGGGPIKIGTLAGPGSVVGIGNSVKTLSLVLCIYLHDNIVFSLGPTYNMTDSPSGANQIGFLAHLNIKIPLNDRFSINGIIQYRYVGITEIGPFLMEDTEELPSATVTSNTYIFPETLIDYSHVFVGLGMSLYFIQK
jgi:hypothetical protein